MGNSKLLRVLIVFGLSAIIFLIFSDFIAKGLNKIINPQKEVPQPTQSITIITPITTPGLYWQVFDHPSDQHSFRHRVMYSVEEIYNKREDPDVYTRYNLVNDKTIIAVITLSNEEYSKRLESQLKAKEKPNNKLIQQNLDYFEGKATYLYLIENNKLADALVIVFNTKEKKNFNIEVKNFSNWVRYPNDLFTIAQSFTFY